MTIYEVYHVHVMKPVTFEWPEAQEFGESPIDDDELCGLLEIVTHLYLRQRAKQDPRAADLVAGARVNGDYETTSEYKPFATSSLYELRPLLHRMMADLDDREGVREIDRELHDTTR